MRASYGLMGNNQNVGLYQYESVINAGDGNESVYGNPDITWETVKMLDVGTDISLFKDQFSLTVDWYNKITDDILLYPPIPLSTGSNGVQVPVNSGSVRNRGWEISFKWHKAVTPDLHFDFSAGYSYYKNEILSLRGGPYISGSTINEKGYAIGSYYGFRTDGLLQQSDIDKNVPVFSGEEAGDIKYVDVNKDGVLNDEDRVILGNPNPQGNYFGNVRVDLKNVYLQVQANGFTHSMGVYTGRYTVPINIGGDGQVPMVWQTDYWTPAHTNARLPRLTPNPVADLFPSDFWAVNAAFLRVRYIQAGYDFKPALIKRIGLSSAEVYVNVQNPFTFSQMKHLDPESRGDELTYPLMKFYTLGLTFKFD